MAEVIGTKAVDEVAGSLLTTVKNHINYIWKYDEIVENLRSEAEKLKKMMKRVEQKKEKARVNADLLLAGVEEWVEQALDHISATEEFFKKEANAEKTCFNCLPMCVNLITLHHYGEEATNKVSTLSKHRTNGVAYEGEISIPTPSVGTLELLPKMKNINDLRTHKSLLEEITRCVLDENIQITGIWGIGGVGKTTLATVVAARVKDLFDDVVFVTVSRPVDAEKIKKEVDNAAKRIIQGQKVLIILDDVWDHLKLHTVGIPSVTNHPKFKILLTSRERSVCKAMNAHEIGVDSLPIEEAWILFTSVVGESVETDAKLNEVARKVVKGCGGLPLILQAVAIALKDEKDYNEWEEAFKSIEKHKTSDIAPSISSEFAHLRLSYEYLKNEEAKSIFLLCSLFPEDFDIDLDILVYYGVGLELFNDLSLEDAAKKVQRAVKILKSSCLLLDGKDAFGPSNKFTKMHDVVREVALLIASENDTNKFLVEAGDTNLTEWAPIKGGLESYTGISLMLNRISKLPAGYELKFPLLEIFLIQGNRRLSEISDEFTQALKKAKVVDLSHNDISSLPKSLKQLTRLRMLNLSYNKSLSDVSMLGELTQLEILILNKTGITEIPQEIGKLVNLRAFLVASCPRLSHIAPDVLSKLHWLEELNISFYPVEEEKDNTVVEIGKLSKLKRLKWFSIVIGEVTFSTPGNRTLTCLRYHLDISHLTHVRELIKVCDGIHLGSIENLKNIIPFMSCDGLKSIRLGNCAKLLCLVDSGVLDEMQSFHPSNAHKGVKENTRFLSKVENLQLFFLSSFHVIWNCPDQYVSLNNLVTCDINSCPKLEKLFSVRIAQGLVNLRHLTICMCNSLKEVISDRDEETGKGEINMVVPAKNIVFPRLFKIYLFGNLNLTTFYPGDATIEYPSLETVEIKLCYKMEKWGYGTHDTPSLGLVNDTEANGSTINEMLAKTREPANESLIKLAQDPILSQLSTGAGPSSSIDEKFREEIELPGDCSIS